MRRVAVPCCAAVLLLLAVPGRSEAPASGPLAAYEQLRKLRFSTPIPVPTGGLQWRIADAAVSLESGNVRVMEPLPDGTVTGVVFEGKGRLTIDVADPVERAQLHRFARKAIDRIDTAFSQMVIRTADAAVRAHFPTAASSTFSGDSLARKRHDHWMQDYRTDTDARILAAILNAESLTTADFKTDEFDWLTWDYDGLRQEEEQLIRWVQVLPEVWLSLDRPEDRQPDGRPGERLSVPADIEHIDLEADLTRYGRIGEIGVSHQRTINGRYVVDEEIAPLIDGRRALAFEIDPTAHDVKVSEEGADLPVIREHIGARFASIDNRYWDPRITVILAQPLRNGQHRHLRFSYELETANYGLGNTWYPTIAESYNNRYTATMELTVNKRNQVRAVGTLKNTRDTDKGSVSLYVIDRPVAMMTFSTSDRVEEQEVMVPGIPRVVSFATAYQFGSASKTRNVAADVANSLQFFQNVFQTKVPGETFYVTSIAAGHGQAFDGFLHLGEETYTGEHPGASELFRAHEVAHEWWGHKVGWKTYRDQWLSEAFAEYSAMLFVQATVKGGEKFFHEILEVDDSILKGSLNALFSKFNRPYLIQFNAAYRNRLGPIGVGYRAGTREIPTGYQIQTYVKGPMVLHMLRTMLRNKTTNDELFIKILSDFAIQYDGKAASTADFRRIVEKDATGDWRWFFREWIDEADIPTYEWRHSEEAMPDGKYKVTIEIKRSGVRDDFIMPIPIDIELPDGKVGRITIVNKTPEQTVTQIVSGKPRGVTFNPEYSVLAYVKGR
jgi:Peptidase family M1 domain